MDKEINNKAYLGCSITSIITAFCGTFGRCPLVFFFFFLIHLPILHTTSNFMHQVNQYFSLVPKPGRASGKCLATVCLSENSFCGDDQHCHCKEGYHLYHHDFSCRKFHRLHYTMP